MPTNNSSTNMMQVYRVVATEDAVRHAPITLDEMRLLHAIHALHLDRRPHLHDAWSEYLNDHLFTRAAFGEFEVEYTSMTLDTLARYLDRSVPSLEEAMATLVYRKLVDVVDMSCVQTYSGAQTALHFMLTTHGYDLLVAASGGRPQ